MAIKKPVFHLTRQAAHQLRDIYDHSAKEWGKKVALRYMDELYDVLGKITLQPELGKIRKPRSTPFLMVPAGKHFVVYDILNQKIIILTFLHQRQNIEHIIVTMKSSFLSEIESIKKQSKA